MHAKVYNHIWGPFYSNIVSEIRVCVGDKLYKAGEFREGVKITTQSTLQYWITYIRYH